MSNKKLSWKAVKQPVHKLKKLKKNPRLISSESFERLKERIKSRGFHDVVKVDTDGTILSGNQRKSALVELNIKEVITLVPNRKLTKEERQKIILESNINDGTWDTEELKSFDLDLLSDVGFDDVQLSEFWKDDEIKDEDFDVDEEIKKIKKPKTKSGDLIILGNHRLICSDSTDPKTLNRLFETDRASMIISDPPYNIDLSYDKGIGGKGNYGGNVKDNKTYEEYKEFIKKSLEAGLSVSKKDLHCFYWCDQNYIGLMQDTNKELGLKNRRVCLWLKNSQNCTPKVAFNKCYEPAVYSTLGRPYISKNIQNLNEVMNKEISTGNAMMEEALDQLDVWLVKRVNGKDYEHPTMKPPKLYEKAIRRCSKVNEIILDSFGGSGSTLIACEQLKRRAYLVEQSEVFCDVIIKRFEQLTGIKAKVIHEKR